MGCSTPKQDLQQGYPACRKNGRLLVTLQKGLRHMYSAPSGSFSLYFFFLCALSAGTVYARNKFSLDT